MGHRARKIRHENDLESFDDSGVSLEGDNILDLLEIPEAPDDVYDPARGLAYGIIIGAALWVLGFFAYLLAT
jgi:hypothetical protein